MSKILSTAVSSMLLSICFAALPMQSANAATRTWIGNQSTGNSSTRNQWDKANNWSGAVVASGDDIVFSGTTSHLANQNNLTNLILRTITFNANTAAYTLDGNAITSGTAGVGGITNNSTNTQTINLSITLGAAQTWNAASGGFIFGGSSIALGGHLLTIGGGFDTSISGVISSTTAGNGIVKTGIGTLTLSGNNSYNGDTTINAGSVFVNGVTSGQGNYSISNSAATLGGSGTIGLASGKGVTISGSSAAARAILDPGSSANAIGTLTVNGGNGVTLGDNGTLSIAISGTSGSRLTVGGALDISSASNRLALTMSGATLGRYTIASASSINSGSNDAENGGFAELTGLDSKYVMQLTSTQVNVVHKPVISIGTITGPPRLFQDTSANVNVAISNSAPVNALNLNFSAAGSGQLTGSGTGSAVAAGSAVNNSFTFNAGSTLGMRTGTVTITDPLATNSGTSANVSVQVVGDRMLTSSNGSAATAVDFGRIMQGQVKTAAGNISSGAAADRANISLAAADTVSGPITIKGTTDGAFNFNLATAQNTNRTLSLNTTGLTLGTNTGVVGFSTGSALSNEFAEQSAQTVDVHYKANVLTNRTLSATAVSLGRMMVSGTSASQTSTISSATNQDNSLTRVTLASTASTASVTGGSVTLGAGTAYAFGGANDAVNSTTRGVTATFSSAGAKSGTATFNPTGEGLAGESVQAFTVAYSGTAVNNRTVSTTSVNLGRMLVNQSGTGSTTISSAANTDNTLTRVTLGASSQNAAITTGTLTLQSGSAYQFGGANDATNSTARDVSAVFTSAGSKSGTATFTPQAEGLTGENVQAFTIAYTATAVNNRSLSASSVNLGNVLVGFTTASQTTTVNTPGNQNDNAHTRVTLNGSAASAGGVIVAAATSNLFDSGGESKDRAVTGIFTSSGVKTGAVGLSVTGEGLAGESVTPVSVNYAATAYDAASVQANNSSKIGDGENLTISNASGTFRAGAQVGAAQLTGGSYWNVGAFSSSVVSAGNSASAAVSFAAQNLLNGTHRAQFAATLNNDLAIQGAAVGDLGSLEWDLAQTVSGNSNDGTAQVATVLSGQSYSGFGTQHDSGLFTEGTLLEGIAADERTISISFSGRPSNSFQSDILTLHGTGSDTFVLQLSYQEAPGEEGFSLVWFDTSDSTWKNAVLGNTGGTFYDAGDISYGLWRDIHTDELQSYLGYFGRDTINKTAWAILDHNSDFSVSAIPEPSTIWGAVLLVGSFIWRRHRR